MSERTPDVATDDLIAISESGEYVYLRAKTHDVPAGPIKGWRDRETARQIVAEIRALRTELEEAKRGRDGWKARVEEAEWRTQKAFDDAVEDARRIEAAEAALKRKDAALREAMALADEWDDRALDINAEPGTTDDTIQTCLIASASELRDALSQQPEEVESCYCTPGVYTPSATCPVHGATTEPEETG